MRRSTADRSWHHRVVDNPHRSACGAPRPEWEWRASGFAAAEGFRPEQQPVHAVATGAYACVPESRSSGAIRSEGAVACGEIRSRRKFVLECCELIVGFWARSRRRTDTAEPISAANRTFKQIGAFDTAEDLQIKALAALRRSRRLG
jgi:hypothetical protein